MTSHPIAPMARAALLAALGTGALALVVGALVAGIPGGLGALTGLVISVAFLSISLLIGRFTLEADPNVMMAAAMGSFVAKLVLFFFGLLVVQATGWLDYIDRPVFGVSAGAVAVAFAAGEAVGFTRTRRLVWDVPAGRAR